MLDPKIRQAIESATRSARQSTGLAQRLIAWFEAVTSGNEDITDRDAAERRLEVLYAETSVEGQEGAK